MLAKALARGESVTAAAKRARYSRPWAHHLLADPDFQARVEHFRAHPELLEEEELEPEPPAAEPALEQEADRDIKPESTPAAEPEPELPSSGDPLPEAAAAKTKAADLRAVGLEALAGIAADKELPAKERIRASAELLKALGGGRTPKPVAPPAARRDPKPEPKSDPKPKRPPAVLTSEEVAARLRLRVGG